jgi:hypothetical protein
MSGDALSMFLLHPHRTRTIEGETKRRRLWLNPYGDKTSAVPLDCLSAQPTNSYTTVPILCRWPLNCQQERCKVG